jgi:hypothetical protein
VDTSGTSVEVGGGLWARYLEPPLRIWESGYAFFAALLVVIDLYSEYTSKDVQHPDQIMAGTAISTR